MSQQSVVTNEFIVTVQSYSSLTYFLWRMLQASGSHFHLLLHQYMPSPDISENFGDFPHAGTTLPCISTLGCLIDNGYYY